MDDIVRSTNVPENAKLDKFACACVSVNPSCSALWTNTCIEIVRQSLHSTHCFIDMAAFRTRGDQD